MYSEYAAASSGTLFHLVQERQHCGVHVDLCMVFKL